MNIAMILEMAASAGDRPAVTAGGRTLTTTELLRRAHAAARRFADRPAVVYLGANHLTYPVALFGAALAGVPFVPMNYRLGPEQLATLRARHPGALVLNPGALDDIEGTDEQVTAPYDADAIAVLLYTSGTTAEPKAAVLRHRHLLAYILNTLEFGSAGADDAALVAVPPYHIAGLANLLTNIYTGRRVVYMPSFDPNEWLETVRRERITHSLVVPTMLARIVQAVGGDDARTPTLRSLAYGGARTPRPVLERALQVFRGTGFVNAYGLTETASSIAVLGPNDHRKALAATDPAVRDRLTSVGRALPGIEFQIRTVDGDVAPVGEIGLVFARGDQISGEYRGQEGASPDGWFATRDRGRMDADGYLWIEGRDDDTIIRGGENIAPAEIEDVLLTHPDVVEAAVVGVPDPEWGQRLVAVLVGTGDPAEIRRWAKDRLRTSKTPDTIVFRPELPKTASGKLIRRALLADLEETSHA